MTILKQISRISFKTRGQHLSIFELPGGESFSDLQKRGVPFLEQIPESDHVLIVIHAGVIRGLLAQHLNLQLNKAFTIKLSYGELVIFREEGSLK